MISKLDEIIDQIIEEANNAGFELKKKKK